MNNIGCAGCHRRTDPPGLALEHFDGLGQLRTMENGTMIDVSADLDGVKFTGAQGLGRLLRFDPRVPVSLVRNVYAYGVGRKTEEHDEKYLLSQARVFARSGYRLPDLVVQIAASPEFFTVRFPSGVQPARSSNEPATVSPRKSGGNIQ